MDGCLLKSPTDSLCVLSSALAARGTMNGPEGKTSGLGSLGNEAMALSDKVGLEVLASFKATFGTDGGSIG